MRSSVSPFSCSSFGAKLGGATDELADADEPASADVPETGMLCAVAVAMVL